MVMFSRLLLNATVITLKTGKSCTNVTHTTGLLPSSLVSLFLPISYSSRLVFLLSLLPFFLASRNKSKSRFELLELILAASLFAMARLVNGEYSSSCESYCWRNFVPLRISLLDICGNVKKRNVVEGYSFEMHSFGNARYFCSSYSRVSSKIS